MNGLGRIFKRGSVYWIAYCYRGKERRESTRGNKRSVARKLLGQRLAEAGAGRIPAEHEDRLSVDDLLDDVLADYQVNGRTSLPTMRGHVAVLREAFGLSRAVDITTARLRKVMVHWQAEGAANATINRRLAALKRGFSLAEEAGKLSLAPRFPKRLAEENVRQGFFEKGEFLAVMEHLPPDLQDFAAWAYWTGMRLGEIASLTWAAFDREDWTLRLPARHAKNRRSRVLELRGPWREIIERRVAVRRLDCPYIFYRAASGLPNVRDGEPIRNFEKAWKRACKAAGLEGKRFHDFRRSGVRNLVRAGVSPSVAMAISGHRTHSIFERYNITSGDDLREAVDKLAAYWERLPTAPTTVALTG